MTTTIDKASLTDIPFSEDNRNDMVDLLLDTFSVSIEQQKVNEKDKKCVGTEESSESPYLDFPVPNAKPFHDIRINNYFYNSQRWKGFVTEINESTFSSKLIDLNNPNTYEIAEFDVREVSADDRELLQAGAVFYWSIGYGVRNGSVKKESLIRFQRLPTWESAYIDYSQDRATTLAEGIIWD